jgi:hypothetical protein
MFVSAVRFGVLTTLLVASAWPAFAASVELSAVTIHLFMQGAGEFSPDVSKLEPKGAWNFVPLDESLADDRFYSFLVKVEFTAAGEAFASGKVADVLIRNTETGEVVLQRELRSLYVGPKGRAFVPVLVSGHACERLLVQVTSETRTLRSELPFACGE